MPNFGSLGKIYIFQNKTFYLRNTFKDYRTYLLVISTSFFHYLLRKYLVKNTQPFTFSIATAMNVDIQRICLRHFFLFSTAYKAVSSTTYLHIDI